MIGFSLSVWGEIARRPHIGDTAGTLARFGFVKMRTNAAPLFSGASLWCVGKD